MSRPCTVSPEGERRDAARRAASLAAGAAGLWLAAALPACGGADAQQVHQLGPSRVVDAVGRDIQWNASPAERHGISARDFGGAGMAEPGDAVDGDGPGLHWETPPGWKPKPPAPFRDVNFQAGDDPR